jgi:polyhydroxybutyrate depolymerase
LLGILWWGTFLMLGDPHLHGRGYLEVILVWPDWMLGQKDTPDQLLFSALHYCAPAVLLAAFVLGLWRVLKLSRNSVLALTLLLATDLSYLLVGAFPNDPGLYQDSAVRGFAGSTFAIVLPAAVVLVGIASRRSGWTGASLWSLTAGIAMVWWALVAAALSAVNGTHQPQLSGDIILQCLASAWYVGMGTWLLWLSRAGVWRDSANGPVARFFRRIGAGLTVLSAVGLAASLVLLSVILGPSVTAQVTGRTQVASLTQEIVTRWYRVYRPAHLVASPGLVIALHGALADGYQIEVQSAFDLQADRLGWIVAYPDGVADGWDAYSCCHHPGVDDVVFIAKLIDHLETTDSVDANRVYITGFSRGAMMSYRIGCELSSGVAAIAPVSGNMATATGNAMDLPCFPHRPISVLAIHGTADPKVPLLGGYTDIVYSPLSEIMRKWRELDQCSDSPTVNVSGPSTTTSWPCSHGSTVAMRVVAGGGHAWPASGANGIFEPNGPDRSFDASSVIADFFLSHPRTAAT